MHAFLRSFRASEHGAVTVDWVVLCAAVVVLGATIVVSISTGTIDLADRTMLFTPGEF